MNIFEKMSAITGELNAVAKNLKVGEGRSAYKAVGEADVLAAVKPLEAKYGVYSYPVARQIVDRDIITVHKTYNGQDSESTKVFLRIETVYRFVNMEKPDEYVDITTYGDGVDANDKAPGKAMTYGDKYALLKAYKIITGDDPDQTISEDSRRESAEKVGQRVPPAGDEPVVCDACGARFSDYYDGRELIKAAALGARSKKRFGRVLCMKCAKGVEAG